MDKLMTMLLLVFLSAAQVKSLISRVPSFAATETRRSAVVVTRTYTHRLYMNVGNGGEDDTEDGFLRDLIELNWKDNTMGIVPLDPEKAAVAAAECVARSLDERPGGVLLVDILLPNYDIVSGENYYDEVMAVEFCITMANTLAAAGKSLQSPPPILLTNDKAVESVTKYLDIRSSDDKNKDEVKDTKDGSSEIESFRGKLEGIISSNSISSSSDDDKADNNNYDNNQEEEELMVDDFELFRDQLDFAWEDDNDEPALKEKEQLTTASPASYRIGSLFGKSTDISGGGGVVTGMTDKIVNAVKASAFPFIENDNVVVILSSATMGEMIAARKLVKDFGETKKFVFVNCRLDPIPREFTFAGVDVAYSFAPFVARKTDTEDDEVTVPLRAVVVRRYPYDWQIFIDDGDGTGFQFVESVPKGRCPSMKGPSTEYIIDCIEKYVDFRKR